MTDEPPCVFDFDVANDFFRAWMERARLLDGETNESVGAYLGVSRGAVAASLRGDRPLPTAEFPKLASLLGLDEHETAYLKALDDERRATTRGAELYARRQADTLRRQHDARRLTPHQVELLGKWYYATIREILMAPGAPSTAEAIASSLRPPVDVSEVEQALDLLDQLGVDHPRVTTGDDDPERLGAHVQKVALHQASDALDTVAAELRESQSFTTMCSAEGLERLREEMRTALKSWMAWCENDTGTKDRVLQVGLYAYPVAEWTTGDG